VRSQASNDPVNQSTSVASRRLAEAYVANQSVPLSRRAVLRLNGGTVILEGNAVASFFFISSKYLNAAGSFYQVLS
jgi:hypothetical protein